MSINRSPIPNNAVSFQVPILISSVHDWLPSSKTSASLMIQITADECPGRIMFKLLCWARPKFGHILCLFVLSLDLYFSCIGERCFINNYFIGERCFINEKLLFCTAPCHLLHLTLPIIHPSRYHLDPSQYIVATHTFSKTLDRVSHMQLTIYIIVPSYSLFLLFLYIY